MIETLLIFGIIAVMLILPIVVVLDSRRGLGKLSDRVGHGYLKAYYNQRPENNTE